MSYTTDEILQRIQDRLEARKVGAVAPGGIPDRAPSSAAVKLTPDQITGEVFIIAPTQIEFVAETFANAMADALNMRAFAPRIREIALSSLRSSLTAAKSQGTGKKPS